LLELVGWVRRYQKSVSVGTLGNGAYPTEFDSSMKGQDCRVANAARYFVRFDKRMDDVLQSIAHRRVFDRNDAFPLCRRAVDAKTKRREDVENPVH
jgi:hypothetical protein